MGSVTKRGRKLQSEDQVFTQNAWDDTEWSEDMIVDAEAKLEEQRRLSHDTKKDVELLESTVGDRWNQFYAVHEDKFFKDRKWLLSEFPEFLARISDVEYAEPCNIFEVGCGVGNAVVHLLEENKNPNLTVYCCDLSENAIQILKKRDFHNRHRDKINAFQADICHEFDSKVRSQIQDGSLDYIMLIFTLSALRPGLQKSSIRNLARLLKPNGKILFRDYGRFDLTQLRFKGKAFLEENYYIRADGTTSFFFTEEHVIELFTGDNLMIQDELKQDNRLLVNRSKGIKMCRCWIQGIFRKCENQVGKDHG